MICPKCGSENPDTAAKCSACLDKFRLGHAHGDSGHIGPMMHMGPPRAGYRPMFLILILLAGLILGLAIILSFTGR